MIDDVSAWMVADSFVLSDIAPGARVSAVSPLPLDLLCIALMLSSSLLPLILFADKVVDPCGRKEDDASLTP